MLRKIILGESITDAARRYHIMPMLRKKVSSDLWNPIVDSSISAGHGFVSHTCYTNPFVLVSSCLFYTQKVAHPFSCSIGAICLLLYCEVHPPETPFFFVTAVHNILLMGNTDKHSNEFQFGQFIWKQVVQERLLFESQYGNNNSVPERLFSNHQKCSMFEMSSE
jgi:hypothetical protein